MTCKGTSVLHFLCECHVSDPLAFMRVIKLLVQHGASADLANKRKQTPLHVAVEGANTQAVLILLNECKANFLLPDWFALCVFFSLSCAVTPSLVFALCAVC
jgi:Ankyrin repeats (3 copies)